MEETGQATRCSWRSRSASLLVVILLLGGCGRDEPPPEEAAGRPAVAPSAERGPLDFGSVRVLALEGTARWRPGESAAEESLAVGRIMTRGARIALDGDAVVVLQFSDGAGMEVSGPASLCLRLLQDYARTIDVESGIVTRLESKAVVTGVTVPSVDGFVAFQGGSVSVEVPADGRRAVFRNLDSTKATAVDGTRRVELRPGEELVVERKE